MEEMFADFNQTLCSCSIKATWWSKEKVLFMAKRNILRDLQIPWMSWIQKGCNSIQRDLQIVNRSVCCWASWIPPGHSSVFVFSGLHNSWLATWPVTRVTLKVEREWSPASILSRNWQSELNDNIAEAIYSRVRMRERFKYLSKEIATQIWFTKLKTICSKSILIAYNFLSTSHIYFALIGFETAVLAASEMK